jgi:hypothetical protein
MNRKTALIIALQTVIIIVLFWVLVFYGKDEYEAATQGQDDNIASASHVSAEQGATVITLSEASQQQSGLQTTPLKAATHRASVVSFGLVANLEPLIEQRTRFLAAKSDAEVVRATLAASQQEYQRLLQLNRDNRNVSDRAVQSAQAALSADEAKLAAAETAASSLRDAIRQQWGETLARWATQPSPSPELQQLLQYHDALIQVSLPFDSTSPDTQTPLAIEPAGSQGQAEHATFVSAAPQTDSTLQGKTFFYRAPATNLRAGMRVSVHMPSSGKAITGILVPQNAVVWYANQAWVYTKVKADKFVRQPINTDTEVGDSWFNVTGFKAGDTVVTRGAQLLLSEEFKYQIKNENED